MRNRDGTGSIGFVISLGRLYNLRLVTQEHLALFRIPSVHSAISNIVLVVVLRAAFDECLAEGDINSPFVCVNTRPFRNAV